MLSILGRDGLMMTVVSETELHIERDGSCRVEHHRSKDEMIARVGKLVEPQIAEGMMAGLTMALSELRFEGFTLKGGVAQ